ncbi:glycosyltransferase [Mycolicibacterium vaccae]|uniref:UDP-glucuronosyl/UDP-glucosyltransferase n=1 Tax=Mycolicibacterium vaccae ATCC 25954 TaxID=1194972 RepID=K0UK31_MYCVA|nr:nucleotide disphospho-sugar-binding domain-containing protein [Mycolicibacterium vaccae]ANI42780.1 glycosyl transferase [Mycolicibacterium vaccae 95051]EJZ07517.1 UDP-glucuronosyl/UDP-glucosyltransferase [Mycolicibacterium vaccae ATCC 25954]
MTESPKPLTIMFWPESAYGPTNQCIGVAAKLRERGHRIVFAAESSWAGKIERYGFIEELVDLAEPSAEDADADAGQFWTDFIAETAPEFAKPTIEQLDTFIRPTFQALIDGAKYCEPRLREIIAEHQPDVLVEDNVVLFPALATAGKPFVRFISCSPLEVPGPDVPPPFSGLPSDDRAQWGDYTAEFDRVLRPVWEEFDAWVREQGAAPLPELEFMPRDNAATVYIYPAAADYTDRRPLDESWIRVDSSIRETDDEYELPAAMADRPEGSALVYLSLGSLGAADVTLMQRLVDVLGRTPHRFIVSKGPQADKIELAANMVGAQMLPQTRIMPLVDAVISHGGNNTTTEALHFGKPLIVLPLFWDQYENAQRIHELDLGVRLDTYHFGDDELISALERILTDDGLRDRVAQIGKEIRERDGLLLAADTIERVGHAHRAATD